jgi:hypothetical protein
MLIKIPCNLATSANCAAIRWFLSSSFSSFWTMVDISLRVRCLDMTSFLQIRIRALRGCDKSAECREDSGNTKLRRRRMCFRLAGLKLVREIGLRWVIAGTA